MLQVRREGRIWMWEKEEAGCGEFPVFDKHLKVPDQRNNIPVLTVSFAFLRILFVNYLLFSG